MGALSTGLAFPLGAASDPVVYTSPAVPAPVLVRGDLALAWDAAACSADAEIVANDLQGDAGLETAVLLSLFLDRRAEDGDALPDGTDDRRGWWGDAFPVADSDRVGSRLWMLEREKPTATTARRAGDYAREALAWLVEDKVASKVEATAAIRRPDAMVLSVAIYRPGKSEPTRYRFDGAWRAMED